MSIKRSYGTVTISVEHYNDLRDFKESVIKNDYVALGYFEGGGAGLKSKEFVELLKVEIKSLEKENIKLRKELKNKTTDAVNNKGLWRFF